MNRPLRTRSSIATRMIVVVLGLYLLIAAVVTATHIGMEYRYQKANILQDLGEIELSCEGGLSVSMWGMDEEALRATVKGMLNLPTLVGVKVVDKDGVNIALAGVVEEDGKAADAGFRVDLTGCEPAKNSAENSPKSFIEEQSPHNFEIFQRTFKLAYSAQGEYFPLGTATIYSDSSVIYRRTRLQVTMLAMNVAITLVTFSLALMWVVKRYLGRPLRILTDATANISLENLQSFSVDTKTSGRNEIRILEEAITSMVADLHQANARREEMEAFLRDSEARYRGLVESTSDWVWEVDARGAYTYASPQVEEILGYTPEEVLGQTPFDLMPPDEAERVKTLFGDLAKNREPIVLLENVNLHKDGHPVVLETSGVPVLDDDGNLTGFRGVDRDVTDRKEIEKEREDLIEKLEHQNAELERFTYTVSHDLKSPLITIKGFIGMLRQELAENGTDMARQDLERISGAADKMDRLLRDLLELSRIGRMVNPPENVPLDDLAREALEVVRGQVEENGVQVDIADGLPVVFGDRVRLLEVYQNLIDNAVKYIGTQPDPKIEIGARTDGPLTNAPQTVCYVRDNGIGIEPHYHTTIFGLFNQLNPKIEGSGIGLSLVERIIQLHGGRIWVESDGPNHGSTFCFTFAEKTDSPENPAKNPLKP